MNSNKIRQQNFTVFDFHFKKKCINLSRTFSFLRVVFKLIVDKNLRKERNKEQHLLGEKVLAVFIPSNSLRKE